MDRVLHHEGRPVGAPTRRHVAGMAFPENGLLTRRLRRIEARELSNPGLTRHGRRQEELGLSPRRTESCGWARVLGAREHERLRAVAKRRGEAKQNDGSGL